MSFADNLEVLYEDNHLIAINKPSGWPSAHYDGHEETLDRLVKSYLKEKYAKPGNVFLGVVHRLDKPVTGVLVFARTSKGAARLCEQFRENMVEKVYWAVVELRAEAKAMPEAGTLEDWLLKAPDGVAVVDSVTPGAKQALLHYTIKATHDRLALVEIRPQSGRTHQLRVQFAARGMPIYGDAKYGSHHGFGTGVGLHARSLSFLHPTRGEPITLTAELPKTWRGRFAHLIKNLNISPMK